MLTLTSPVETPYDRWPAGPKLVGLVVLTSTVFAIQNPLVLSAALGGTMAIHLFGGPILLTYGLRLLRPLWPFAALIVAWHLWRDTPILGLVVLLRMGVAVMIANLVTMTTRLDDMISVITRIATPLGYLGLPPRRLALALALAIRFVPDLMQSADRLNMAWRARSARRSMHHLLAPLTLSAIDAADHVAESLRARGGVG